MTFTRKQMSALNRNLDGRFIRTRQTHDGRRISYLEGWFAIAEANRIFGHDGWSRETLETRCVFTREKRGYFLAVYVARVRITVHANGTIVVREGHGSGEGRGTSPAEVHDIAIKSAETDATKRALATFGAAFGLALYRSVGTGVGSPPPASDAAAPDALSAIKTPVITPVRVGLHPDDTTPIPRPSHYHARSQTPSAGRDRRGPTLQGANQLRPAMTTTYPHPITGNGVRHQDPPRDLSNPVLNSGRGEAPPLTPAHPEDLPKPREGEPRPRLGQPARIDKNLLAIPEPKRLRDKAHLKFVATQACVVCGKQPSDAHHLRFAQPRAIGMKVSDEFTVPLCRGHHRRLHQIGNELTWWQEQQIDPLTIARALWEQTHPQLAAEPPASEAPSSHSM